ncbi:MAG: deoxyhypusine synthase [Candidatus Micrarchaeota archaeon]|nr:deoxyhypusine synthase [Candidatus Micrarchaeota archaeon]
MVQRDVYSFDEFIQHMGEVGFQSTHLAQARKILSQMLERNAFKCLSFTANIMASGMRGYLIRMLEKDMVDCVITTGGSIDHDVIKSFMPYEIGSFEMDDKELHRQGINRLGNILVPNQAYELLEKITFEVFKEGGTFLPSEIAHAYGKYLHEKGKRSFLALAYQKNIPIFAPGIVDAAIGLNFYFLEQKVPFKIDVVGDLKKLGSYLLPQEEVGALILGGGIAKHHTIAANLPRGGLNYSIYLTTAAEWDGSLSGAKTREGVSWGKINEEARHVTVYGEATLTLPLLLYGWI